MENLDVLVRGLIAYPTEEEWFEFKENWHEPNGIGEYISSLSNAAAFTGRPTGYLVWGIKDDTHEIIGTEFDYRVTARGEPLEHYLARQTTPDVAFHFEETLIDAKRVVVLVVPAAKTIPTSFAGNRHLRIGSSKVNLVKYPEREAELFAILRSGLPTTDNTAADDQDLSFEQLFTFYAGKGITLKRETFAHNLGLQTNDGHYNLLAQLLSDNSRMTIRVSIFEGATKATRLVSVREFGFECLLVSLSKVLDYGDVLNIVQVDERNRKMAREDVRLFNPDAFREGIINAFVHNAWITQNAPMITVYSDRIEILSRGTLAAGQTVEGFFQGQSIPVNKTLSDIFLQLHISERSGRGVPKITDVYGRQAYVFYENSILLTIQFERVAGFEPNTIGVASALADARIGRENRTRESDARIGRENRTRESDAKTSSATQRTKEQILHCVRAASSPMSRAEIMATTGLKASRTSELLTQLVNEGYLIAEGGSRWRVYSAAQ